MSVFPNVVSIELNKNIVMRSIAFWFLAVSQEPSLGMYYVQNHFKDSLDRTLNSRVKIIELEVKPLERVGRFPKKIRRVEA
jgi:hypothetical protein